jgi:hypothetical protein
MKRVMKNFTLFFAAFGFMGAMHAQIGFNPEFDFENVVDTVLVAPSPLIKQVLFVGGVDMVQTTATYGNPATEVPAKQWHDFIGFTPDVAPGSADLGWLSVNHEMIEANDKIGDGGGMTVFKVKRDPSTDSLIIVNQTLLDGRSGKFFNVDFVNTVGETGMNCGGISSDIDGRIWTAEEWMRSSNSSIYNAANGLAGGGVQDTLDYTISGSPITFANGTTMEKYENFNYMVEIDPRQAVALHKQYNWGRQAFEGGVIMPDNKTVYLTVDDTPAFFTKFIANTAGDFSDGIVYVYKQGASNPWIALQNNMTTMLNFKDSAVAVGATMFDRLEWSAYNPADGNVYLTETGLDAPSGAWLDEYNSGATYALHHIARAATQGVSNPGVSAYKDYYGRVLKFDVTTNTMTSYLEGGPSYSGEVTVSNYPAYHLSNPDGLTFMTVNNKTYMVICEDLNGTSNGRMPAGISNKSCELFLLDAELTAPMTTDLVRIAQVPYGAEVTGAKATPDGKTLLFNSQHPSTSNPFPYNNSCTIALTGWDKTVSQLGVEEKELENGSNFQVYPNPTSRVLYFNTVTDVALYDSNGTLVLVERNTKSVDIIGLKPGVYFLKNKEGIAKKVIIQ